jgi:polar amino acid transport system substrate-binding protein
MRHPVISAVFTLALSMLGVSAATAQQTDCAPDKLGERYPALVGKTVQVGITGAQAPYTFRDAKNLDHFIGADIDLMTDAFACIGVPFKFNTGAFAGLITSVTEGRNDVMWDSLVYTPPRAKQVDFVMYETAGTGFVVKKGNPKQVTSLDSVCGLNVGAMLGTVQEAAFREQGKLCVKAGKPDVNLLTFGDEAQGDREVVNGRIDVIMNDLGQAAYLASQQPDLEVAFGIQGDLRIGAAVNKGESALLQAIADAMKIEQTSGKQKVIMVKYGLDPSLIFPVEVRTQ